MIIGTKVIQTKLLSSCRNLLAITLFGFVFTSDKRKVDRYVLNHELIHCQQQLEWLYLPFFILYLAEWMMRFVQYRDFNKAYHAVSFEREAYDNDYNMNYLSQRKHFANYRRTKHRR